MTEEQAINQVRESFKKAIIDVMQSEMADRDMKPYKIKIRTLEEWETPDGNLHSTSEKFERTIWVASFKAAMDYVQENFNVEGVTITYLKIKEIN